EHARVLQRCGAEHADVARGRELLPREHRHERRLAGPVAAEQPDDLVLLEAERHVVDRAHRAVALGEVADFDHGAHAGASALVVSSIIRVSWVAVMPSFSASASSGWMYWSR